MGLKAVLDVIVTAGAQSQGFRDGANGKPVALQFTDGFPQDTQLARAYHKAYAEGRKSAVPQALNKVNGILDKMNGA